MEKQAAPFASSSHTARPSASDSHPCSRTFRSLDMKEQAEQSAGAMRRPWMRLSRRRKGRHRDRSFGRDRSDERRGCSRSSLKLSGGQQQLLEAVAASGKPVVLVLGERPAAGHLLGSSTCSRHPGSLVSGQSGRQRYCGSTIRRRESWRPFAGQLAAQQRPCSGLLQS